MDFFDQFSYLHFAVGIVLAIFGSDLKTVYCSYMILIYVN